MALTGSWNIHSTLPHSRANGPGVRFVIWMQGCTLNCPGCFNPGTHDPAGAHRQIESTLQEVLRTEGIEGVTISGGEPLQQPEAVADFCEAVRAADLGVIVLTGYTRPEIMADPARLRAASNADTLVCGRFNQDLLLGQGLRGSRNKEFWFVTNRYDRRDFDSVPDAEVVIEPDGTIVSTGIRPAMIGGLS